jgi:acyl-CoA synthetase (AMP-forming)/AMP-acid ligase II
MVFWELYGLTEGPSTILDPKIALNKPASVGVPANFHAFYVIDEEGNMLPPNEVGELAGYGNSMLKGYYKKPEYTKSVSGLIRQADTSSKLETWAKSTKTGISKLLTERKI